MNMETFRVTKEVALAKTPLAKLDLGEATLVKVDRAIPHAHDTKRVRYRDPACRTATRWPRFPPAFPKRSSGSMSTPPKSRSGPFVRVPLTTRMPTSPDVPTDADRKPNNFIQSDDPLIVAQAKEAAGDETDPWKVAVALEAYVNRAVTKKDFSQALATASEVARNREGDCKGHAVYLAALARARKIPARVAMGLVYMPQSQTFGYHMWTEVYVAGRWIGLDGTLAKGGIGGGHLQLTHSPMAGAAAYNSFLPVMQVVGQLKLEVLDWE